MITNKKRYSRIFLFSISLVIFLSSHSIFLSFVQGAGSTNFKMTITGATQCFDGQDNDNDGKIDYPNDPGCASLNDNDESNNKKSGGGASTDSLSLPTSVFFSGKAYPNRPITLLQDGKIILTTMTDKDATFNLSITNLIPGEYVFSLYSIDFYGKRSKPISIPLSIIKGSSITISDIDIAPTIAINKSNIVKNDKATIFGQSIPSSTIQIFLQSEKKLVFHTTTDTEGKYSYTLDTSILDFGKYKLTSKIITKEDVSDYGETIGFEIVDETASKEELPPAWEKADINKDRKVNLIDFSLVMYWYKKISPPQYIDLNNDGCINVKDFSIVAYYWTG